MNNKLEQKIKSLLVANKTTALDCRRPEGRFQVVANLTTKGEDERGNPIEMATDPVNWVYRDGTAKDLCPTCASAASSQACQCLDAYMQYDYYEWYCVGGGGHERVPATRQLPAGCPSFESLRMRGQISNYPLGTDDPYTPIRTYQMLIDFLMDVGPASSSMPQGNWPNVFGPTRLTNPEMQGPTTPGLWEQFWTGAHPNYNLFANSPFASPGGMQLAKMMFDARCGIRAEVTSGACCIFPDFGAANCSQVAGPSECDGVFHAGKNCGDGPNGIGANCERAKLGKITPSKKENTQLGRASINDMIIKAIRGKRGREQ